MKICSYCGKPCADDATVCPIDGQPVVNAPERLSEAPAPPQTARPAFDVKLIVPILAAGVYRVFVERSDLIFIQMQGGSKSILAAVAPLLGPFGGAVPLADWLFTRRKAGVKRQRLETDEPEVLLREDDANFKLNLAEIRDAAIEPAAAFAVSGKAGRLNLVVRHGERIRCEFVNTNEMNRAIHLLVPLMNATLQVNVVWNGEKQQFERKKKDLTR